MGHQSSILWIWSSDNFLYKINARYEFISWNKFSFKITLKLHSSFIYGSEFDFFSCKSKCVYLSSKFKYYSRMLNLSFCPKLFAFFYLLDILIRLSYYEYNAFIKYKQFIFYLINFIQNFFLRIKIDEKKSHFK